MFAEVRPTLLIEGGTNRGSIVLIFCCAQRTVNGNQCRPQFNTAEEFWSSGTTITCKSSIDKSNSSECAGATKKIAPKPEKMNYPIPVVNYLHGYGSPAI